MLTTHTELAAMRRRFGWRRLRVLLSREGVHMNHKKLRRLYVEERLQVRRNPPRRAALWGFGGRVRDIPYKWP